MVILMSCFALTWKLSEQTQKSIIHNAVFAPWRGRTGVCERIENLKQTLQGSSLTLSLLLLTARVAGHGQVVKLFLGCLFCFFSFSYQQLHFHFFQHSVNLRNFSMFRLQANEGKLWSPGSWSPVVIHPGAVIT